MAKENKPGIGSYKSLVVYKKTILIYNITHFFCTTFLDSKDRTVDQMIQAARSGKQNIVEGCSAATTSRSTEIKLISVAKASLKELLEDFEDYLRVRGLAQWQDSSSEKDTWRLICRKQYDCIFYSEEIKKSPPEKIANIAIVLLYQEDYLLYRQLRKLEEVFKSGRP